MQSQYALDPKHLGIQVYDLLSRPDIQDRDRAKIIAEALETVQQNYPDLGNTATKRDLSETELRLMKEIELVRGEIKDTELRLLKEIELVRGEIKDTELRLLKEIELVRGEIKDTELKLTKEIEQVRLELTKEMGKQTMRTVTYLTAIMGLFAVLLKFMS